MALRAQGSAIQSTGATASPILPYDAPLSEFSLNVRLEKPELQREFPRPLGEDHGENAHMAILVDRLDMLRKRQFKYIAFWIWILGSVSAHSLQADDRSVAGTPQ